MVKRLLLSLSFCWLVWGIGIAQAHVPLPLIGVANEQIRIWSGEGAMELYTACQPSEQVTGRLIPSPDGSQFLIATLPPIIQEAFDSQSFFGEAPFSVNLWLCDIATNSLTRIVATEGGDAPFTGIMPQFPKIRSEPRWSPDGTQLVWTAFAPASQETFIAIYDIAAQTVEERPLDVPPPFGFPVPPPVEWRGDIAFVTVFVFDEEIFLEQEQLFLYDMTQRQIVGNFALAAGGEADDFIAEQIWLTQEDGSDALGLRFFQSGWVLFNPLTGESQLMDGLPELYSAAAPDDGLALVTDLALNFNFVWRVRASDRQLEGYPKGRIAISPDGQRLAFVDSVLRILSLDGSEVVVPNSDDFADDGLAFIFWGAQSWRVAAGAAVDFSAQGAG